MPQIEGEVRELAACNPLQAAFVLSGWLAVHLMWALEEPWSHKSYMEVPRLKASYAVCAKRDDLPF